MRSKSFLRISRHFFLYKVSNVVLNGTDSVIVSSFLGTGMVGILANYNMIVKNIYNLVLQVFTSTSASIGNLAATEGWKKQFKSLTHAVDVLLDFWVMHYSIICKCKYIYENLGRKRKFVWNSYSTGSYY